MEYFTVAVKVNSSKTCFVDFSDSLLTFWENEIKSVHTLLQTRLSVPVLVHCPGELLTLWSGKSHSDSDVHAIYIDREYAKHYGLEEDSVVQIQFLSAHIPTANQVTVCPCKRTDWEIIQLNSSLIENVLLDHISLVTVGQVFPLHLGLSAVVSLKILSTNPCGMVFLQELTELVVSPFEDLPDAREVENVLQGLCNEEKYLNQTFTYLIKQPPVDNDSDAFVISKVVKCISSLLGNSEHMTKDLKCSENEKTQFSSIPESREATCEVIKKFDLQIQAIPNALCEKLCNDEDADGNISLQTGETPLECINENCNLQTGSINGTLHMVTKTSLPPYQGFVCDTIFKNHHISNKDIYTYIEIKCATEEILINNAADANSDGEENTLSDSDKISIILQVKILPLPIWNNVFNFVKPNVMFVNPFVLTQLQLTGGSTLNVNIYERTINAIKGVVLHCEPCNYPTQKLCEDYYKSLEDEFCTVAKKWIDLSQTVIINEGSVFTFQVEGAPKNVIVEIIGIGQEPCGKITELSFENLFVRVEADEFDEIRTNEVLEKKTLDFESITNDIIEHIKFGFRGSNECIVRTSLITNQVVVLIHGTSSATTNGCGKTLILHSVANYFSVHPYFCHIEYVDCVLLRGKKVSTIFKSWETAFETAILNEPSIVVFDDLDELISTVDLLQDGYMKNVYSERLGELFRSMIEKIVNSNRKVFVIGAVSCLASLHSCILPESNSHLFTKYVSLSTLPFCQVEMLDWFVKNNVENDNYKSHQSLLGSKNLSRKLATYNVKNVSTIATRALGTKFEKLLKQLPITGDDGNCSRSLVTNTKSTIRDVDAVCPSVSHTNMSTPSNLINKCSDVNVNHFDTTLIISGMSEMNLASCDIEENLESFDKILTHDLNIHKAKTIRWESIGGLISVKEILKETLLWPAMYPELLSQCPLRLCSGVLLYGAPGTAKTMLASAVAYESGLNFISVKGPELLSKYVGSSEGNVRDLFARAGTAKPCIIFFDELESMAPRRGHDNTGVTDRVVNQLLTELDGVESLNGVFILAATSRPDLIDPALLRPGRFDKSIHCPMPTEEEREEILCILMKEVHVDSSIDVKLLSKCTPGFSGADLKGLMFNAQVESACEHLALNDTNTDDNSKVGQEHVLITMDHFTKALETTQQSVSAEERNKFVQIFSAFTSHDGVQPERKQKVTLA